MIKAKLIRDYYRDSYNPWLPPDSGFYHYRVKCIDGSWKKVSCKINNPEKLRKKLILLDAGDVYFSTAKWLNPSKIGHKQGTRGGSGYLVADQLMIGSDFCVDFDADNTTLEDLDDVRKTALKFIKRMKKAKGFVKNYILWTGAKGLQVSYTPKDEKLPVDPRKRYQKIFENRKRYKKRYLEGIKFDEKTTLNPLLVRRLPNTINTKTGYVATIITEEILKLPIKKLLAHIPYVTRSRPGIPTKNGKMTRHLRDGKKRLGGVAGLAPQPILNYTNQVLGIKDRFILILEYQEGQKYERDIKFLQRHYRLSKSYLLKGKDDGRLWVFTLQTFPHKRLLKILNKTCALNKSQQKRIHYTRFPVQSYYHVKTFDSNNPLKVASATHKRLVKSLNPEAWCWEGKENFQLSLGLRGE